MPDFETRVAAAKRAIRDASMDGIVRRHVPLRDVEVRADQSGGYTISGHGAVFNSLSENLGGFREQITPGAFSEVLGKSSTDVRALFNHDPNMALARTGNGSLTLEETAHGLAYRATVSPAMADTYFGKAMRAMLDEGLVTQSSFAFRVARGGDVWDEDPETGGLIRTITNFGSLLDVSPVTYPAYPAADSSLSRSVRMDTEGVGIVAQMLVLAADYVADADSEADMADITAMQGCITTLTGLLSAEETEANSSPVPGERTPKSDASQQGTMAPGIDERADETPWRLHAVKRRIALREHA